MPPRRDWLRPDKLIQAAGKLQRELDDAASEVQRWASTPIVTLTHPAMACEFDIQFPASIEDRKTPADGFALVDELEAQLTVYRDDSEVARLNTRAGLGPVVVEDRLFGLLQRCQSLYRLSDGAFDITAGPLIRAWGFRRRQGRVPDAEEIAQCRSRLGMGQVQLDEATKSVSLPEPGMELNLGSIGKGYALDRLAELFAERQFRPVLFSAGHSSILAVGQPPWDDRWQIDILDPRDPQRVAARVRLRDQGLSTSSIAQQHFIHDGQRYAHLIDPRTGWPVQGTLQVTVVAPTAELAEALSTAFFVNGLAWSEKFCRRRPDVGAIYIRDIGTLDQPAASVHIFGNIEAWELEG